jgi:hypothetical protein
MRARRTAAFTALVAGGAVAALSAVHASDHLDGPRATADPQSDLTDVFAFTSPEDPTRVVLAMAVTPYASDASTFSPDVDYAFRVRRVAALQPLTLDQETLDVVCELGEADTGPDTMTCTGPDGVTASAVVGDTGAPAGPAMRVFAGLRSDPAFLDRQGMLATVATGRTSFTGQNSFLGANVLAIVVELDSSIFAREGGVAPALEVAADTTRRAP